jgi:hypothetical protein
MVGEGRSIDTGEVVTPRASGRRGQQRRNAAVKQLHGACDRAGIPRDGLHRYRIGRQAALLGVSNKVMLATPPSHLDTDNPLRTTFTIQTPSLIHDRCHDYAQISKPMPIRRRGRSIVPPPGGQRHSDELMAFQKRWDTLRKDRDYRRDFTKLCHKFPRLGELLGEMNKRPEDVLRVLALAQQVNSSKEAGQVRIALAEFLAKYHLGWFVPDPKIAELDESALRGAFASVVGFPASSSEVKEASTQDALWRRLCRSSDDSGNFVGADAVDLKAKTVTAASGGFRLYEIDGKIWFPLNDRDTILSIRSKVRSAREYLYEVTGSHRRPQINPREKDKARELRAAGIGISGIARRLRLEPPGADLPDPSRKEVDRLARKYELQGLLAKLASSRARRELTLQETDSRKKNRARARVHRRLSRNVAATKPAPTADPVTVRVRPVLVRETGLTLYDMDGNVWVPLDEWDSVSSISEKVKVARNYVYEVTGHRRRPRAGLPTPTQ